MKHREHSYRNGVMGRRLETRPGVGSPSATAFIQCSGCPHEGSLKLSVRMPPEQIDKKFMQAGWALDPHICPGCRAKATERKTMSAKLSAIPAKPSPDAMRAQAQMFHLLQTHFDPNKGAFSEGWDDERIAADTGLAVPVVTEYRETCFGKMKEPAMVQALRNDIAALEKLHKEMFDAWAVEVADLKKSLAIVTAKWAS